MLFTDIKFLFVFFPLVIIMYQIINKAVKDIRIKNIFLFLISLVFYAVGDYRQIFLLIFVIIFNYLFGMVIQKKQKKSYFIIGIVINLLILCLYKYSNFAISNINHLLTYMKINNKLPVLRLQLPIGLSFYIFQAISYLSDVYTKRVPAQKSITFLGLYISFFTNITSGPIVKYEDFYGQIMKRTCKSDNFMYIERFVIGLFKKIFLAIPLGNYADKIFAFSSSELSIAVSWFGILIYTLQIYIDFSSYSDMAISLAGMLGFKIKENFNYPYMCNSIKDFWRRWHISLSTWFKNYIYIPLGGNRKGNLITIRNTIVVFTLCGIWHGANWTFFIWGLYYGIILSIEKNLFGSILEKVPTFLRWMYSMLIVMIGWVFFRSDSIKNAFYYLKSMFSINNNAQIIFSNIANIEIIFIVILSILFCTPIFKFLLNKLNKEKIGYVIVKYIIILLFIVIIIIWMSPTLIGSTKVPFIYSNF